MPFLNKHGLEGKGGGMTTANKQKLIDKYNKNIPLLHDNLGYTVTRGTATYVNRPDTSIAGTGLNTDLGNGRKLVRTNNGHLHAVARTTTQIYMYSSTDNGNSWSNTFLTTSYTSIQDHAVATDGDNIYILVLSNNNTVSVLSMRYFGSTAYTTTIATTSTTSSLGTCAIACEPYSKALHITWTSKQSVSPSSFNLRYSKLEISQVPNTIPSIYQHPAVDVTILNNAAYGCWTPSITMYNKNPVILCQYTDGTNTGVACFTTADGGVTFTRTMASTMAPANRPCAITDKNGFVCVTFDYEKYEVGAARYSSVYFTWSEDGGTTWKTPVEVGPAVSGSSTSLYSSVTVNSNNDVFVVYLKDYLTAYVKHPAGTAYSGGWSSPLQLSTWAYKVPSTLYDQTPHCQNFSLPLTLVGASSNLRFVGLWDNQIVTEGGLGSAVTDSELAQKISEGLTTRKCYASGVKQSNSTTSTFYYANNTTTTAVKFEVTGLHFKPSHIVVYATSTNTGYRHIGYYSTVPDGSALNPNPTAKILNYVSGSGQLQSYNYKIDGTVAYINDGSFSIPVPNANLPYRWEAYE